MKSNKNILLIGLSIFFVGAIAYAAYVSYLDVKTTQNEEDTICTLDAKECPDGSYVGRTGPNCEFICPLRVSTSTGTIGTTSESVKKGPVLVEVTLGERTVPLQEAVTVLSLVEDSRCPSDVQCIQAGTVRIKVKIESGMGIAVQTFTLGETITTETEAMTLTAVRPLTNSKIQTNPDDYRFTFKVERR